MKNMKKVAICEKHDLPYVTEDMLSSAGSEYSMKHLRKRIMKPLFIGDVINYSYRMGGYDPAKLMEGLVVSIDRKSREIRLNTYDVLTP